MPRSLLEVSVSIHVRQCAQDAGGVDVVLHADGLAVTNSPNMDLRQVPPDAALGSADRTQEDADSLPRIEVLLLLATEFGDLINYSCEEFAEAVVAAKGASPRQRLGASPLDLWVEELEHGGDIGGRVEASNHRNIWLPVAGRHRPVGMRAHC